MASPDNSREVFLAPGEYWFGDGNMRVRTVLGSCVAIVMWHPRLQCGGMCHFVLPQRADAPCENFDPYYGEEAIECLLREVRAQDAHPREYQVKLFGGGSMFPEVLQGLRQRGQRTQEALDVAGRNAETARRLARQHGLTVVAEQLGGTGHRSVVFDLWSGAVWVRHRAG